MFFNPGFVKYIKLILYQSIFIYLIVIGYIFFNCTTKKFKNYWKIRFLRIVSCKYLKVQVTFLLVKINRMKRISRRHHLFSVNFILFQCVNIFAWRLIVFASVAQIKIKIKALRNSETELK